MSAKTLDALLEQHPLPATRPVAWGLMALVGLALLWASAAELDEVAVAGGEVVPRDQVKLVQHLEGGIITALYVREGDLVRAGDPLVQLALSANALNQEELAVRIDALTLQKARLEAEAAGKTPLFPDDIKTRRPALMAAETRAFEARAREQEATVAVLREKVKQRELEISELRAKDRAIKENLALAQEKLALSEGLLAEGLTARMEHLRHISDHATLLGESETLDQSIPRALAALEEAKQRVTEERNRFQREAEEMLGQTEVDLARTRELMSRATDQQQRTKIQSPIDGVVKTMRHHTIGGVVQPGEPLMEIVPVGENLIIEAKLNPVDRGYVQEGQPATVKISSYDYARYGGLEGTVTLVAPDSSAGQDGQPYFRVVVTTERTWLGQTEGTLPITPGMEATVDIHTGTRTVLNYLIKPILKMRHEAFRER